jgi:hypothetical protein
MLVLFAAVQTCWAGDTPMTSYGALSATLLARAQAELARIQALVADGTLPKSRLEEAQIRVTDAQDEAILARTLYGKTRIEDMSTDDAQAMIAAAQRRVDRQATIVASRRALLENGVLAKSEFQVFEDELESRRRELGLARDRVQLVQDLRRMADAEQRLEAATRLHAPEWQNVMIRYDGSGQFELGDLNTIASEFQKHFHHALPVSALGETLVHRSMGLDHRNRVDIALNPDQTEGIWLRHFLEQRRIPYLAFRAALAGAATAPHIHIGPASTRLKLAQR